MSRVTAEGVAKITKASEDRGSCLEIQAKKMVTV